MVAMQRRQERQQTQQQKQQKPATSYASRMIMQGLRSLPFLTIGYIIGYHHANIPTLLTVNSSSSNTIRSAATAGVPITTTVNPITDIVTINKQEEEPPSNEERIINIKMQQVMDWKIPADIQEERHKECEGGRKTSSTGGFCLTRGRIIGGNNIVDLALANYLRDNIFNGITVVDLGAGLGHYGKIFTEKGSPVKLWVGFDGAMNVQSATDGLVRFMDLTQPHAADERSCVKGDWVLSLEVAEHIPPQFTDSYIRNIRCSCTVGAVVSWGIPAQTGGLGHVNTMEQKDAIAAMARWGFVVDKEATQAVQEAASMDHFRRNTVVYRVVQTTTNTL